MTNILPSDHGCILQPLNETYTGNIIPHSWYQKITTSSGRPDRTAILILAEIVYWYRPRKVQVSPGNMSKHQTSNTITKTHRVGEFKFQGDVWQTSYEHFEKKFSCSKETIRRTFVKLEAYGLISRELRTISKFGQVYNNRLFLHLHKENLEMLLPNPSNFRATTDFMGEKKICSPDHKLATPSPQIIGELCKERKITEENIDKYRSKKSNFIDKSFCQFIGSAKTLTLNCVTPQLNIQSLMTIEQSQLKHHTISTPESSLCCPTDQKQKGNNGNPDIDKIPNINQLSRKKLSEFYPILEKDAIELRKTSGRDFNLSYINKLLLKLSKEKPDHGFYTKPLFLSYMSKVLACELRQAPMVNNIDFDFATKPGTAEYESNHKTIYLEKVEKSTDTSVTSKLKRKIVGRFVTEEAYDILTKCSFRYETIADSLVSEYLIETHSSITTLQKATLGQTIKEVFGEEVEVTFKEQEPKAIIGQGTSPMYNKSMEVTQVISSSPLWQKIREYLQKRYGDAIDKSWFSRIDIAIEQNSKKQKIYIKAPTTFVKDWVKTNYSEAIEDAIREITKTAKELLPGEDTTDKRYDMLEWRVG